MTAKNDNPVNDRALHFLKVLVERYIRDGQPVGSRTLAKDTGLELSPATVRNVLSDLEDLGLVSSPHTSSGRVPTVSGYRLFLDTLLTVRPPEEIEVDEMRRRFAALGDSAALIATASQVLSGVTRLAGVVMLPRRERNAFRQIEFLPLSGDRVLAILVTEEGEVHNRVLHTDQSYSPSQLEQAANYLNGLFVGRDLREVRRRLVDELRHTHDRLDRLMRQAVELARQVVEVAEDKDKDDLCVAGQTNLMDFSELASMEWLKQLFEAFAEKRQILHLLDRCLEAEGVQIFVGEESGYDLLGGCSLVSAPYQIDGKVIGVLGVIGPARMNYSRVIPIVDVTARLLGAALKNS